jgi:hypothetical protein
MSITTVSTKDLLNQLWLPIVKDAKAVIYPRRRKNARMKLLTLTDGIEPKEVFALENDNLIERKDTVAWVTGMQKKIRIEAESIENVIDGPVYDVSFLGRSCPLLQCFPFDILNLDFSSQNPAEENGRIEKEAQKIERAIKLQQQKDCDKFILIYTTLLDSCSLNVSTIAENSNSVSVDGWSGLNLNHYGDIVTDAGDKRSVLKDIIEELVGKYRYGVDGTIRFMPSSSLGNCNQLYSLALIAVK